MMGKENRGQAHLQFGEIKRGNNMPCQSKQVLGSQVEMIFKAAACLCVFVLRGNIEDSDGCVHLLMPK